MTIAGAPAAISGSIVRRVRNMLRRAGAAMPKGLYTRSLLIIIIPMVLLQAVVAYAFMERHWQLTTRRLSGAVAGEISSVLALYRANPQPANVETLKRIARETLGLSMEIMPGENLPPPGPKPFFDLLDDTLTNELSERIYQPFWIDTVGSSSFVDIRIKIDEGVMRIVARRNAAYASNSHIFLVWMVSASIVLILVAILFLRNQIRPILQLADAAEAFGKGHEVHNFRLRGAAEVRRAALAFMAMKARIERQIGQRTTMLAGVSHDLGTVLTRLKLQVALLDDAPEAEEMSADLAEMERMLQDYLAFARGNAGEPARPIDMADLIGEIAAHAERRGDDVRTAFAGDPVVKVRPDAMKRCIENLVTNAGRFGQHVAITGNRTLRELTVTVEDDGPGIPADQREEVFRPFLRLDEARNQDHAGSGLGLSIARDLARAHGGDITLGDGAMGGLRATLRIPV